jgi:exopolysaccharide biosynthesis predicted pyruvyltransferase EpsI
MTIRDNFMNGAIRDFLRQFSGQRVSYFPNPGNGGDSLIATGTYHLFDDLNISIDVVGPDDDVTGQVVLMAGGGNLVAYYGHTKTALRNFSQRAKTLVLLPHTIRGNEQILQTLDNRCHIFCRDGESYQHVLNQSDLKNVYLGHDMAFNIDLDRIFANKEVADEARASYSHRLRIRHIKAEDYVGAGVVRLFRQDVEARGDFGPGLLDLSAIFAFGVQPGVAQRGTWCFMEFLRRCDAIATDRLHVGIGATILGKDLHLFDNSYGKNYAIYQHSVRRLRDNVSFYRLSGGDASERVLASLDVRQREPAPA